jgi:SAM-dependent methyltransferase
MEIHSVLRLEEHKVLADLTLNGSILDIGGDKRAAYQKLIKGDHALTTVNLDEKSKPDIYHDLEKSLPIIDSSYDNVLLINVLEHIFNYRELLRESARVLKPGGTLVIVVPFLFPVHPSPQDFHRFTESTLRKELVLLHMREIKIQALGKGVFTARYLMLDRLLPAPIRFLSHYTCRYCAYALDWLFSRLSKVLGKKYKAEDYALGYCVTAQK